jgi:hypothetical protein
MLKRIIFSCVIFISMFFMPWWFFSILLGISFYAITGFYEGLCLAFVYDLIYASSFGGTVVPFVMTFLASVLFLAFISFRKFIR